MNITPALFEAFLKCPTKCWLRFTSEAPTGNSYAEWVQTQNESFRVAATERLLITVPADECAPLAGSSRLEETHYSSAEVLKTARWRLALDVPVRSKLCSSRGDKAQTSSPPLPVSDSKAIDQSFLTSAPTRVESCLHAVERIPSEGRGKAAQFIPIRFIWRNKLTQDDKLLLAFDAFVLSQALGREVSLGKIIHGDDRATLKVKLGVRTAGSARTAATSKGLAVEVRKRLDKITALLSSPVATRSADSLVRESQSNEITRGLGGPRSGPAPDLVLNRHCGECEFRDRCRKIAIEKDDLSLLAGMSAKERQKLRSKGIFTVTQLSYTFRPRRRSKRQRDKREKYHHALKALAIREQKIHIVGRPELKLEGTPVYLDVEGLPDRDFYYLIGLRIGHGDSAVPHSLWADTVADEGKIWREFLAILETVEQPVLIHYGSYETNFFNQMAERHGSPQAESVAANAIASARNLVSVMYARIYFPTYSNSLKEIARHLNFEWSDTGASGTGSIAWRQNWEKSRSTVFVQRLVTYNTEDCMALARLQRRLGELFVNVGKTNESTDVVHADSLPRNFNHTFKTNQFQFAEFKQINQAAYWDYQREKVLVRSSSRLKAIAQTSRKKRRARPRPNVILNCAHPTVCPSCGGLTVYKHQTANKMVVDLRFAHGSVKRWVTKYRFYYYRCPDCRAVFYNPERGWTFNKFGPNLQAFCIYQIIELRLSQRMVAAFLNLILGFQISAGNINEFKANAAVFYRKTFEALQQSIVTGALVHADETKVNLHDQSGYVWVFTNLVEVVYLYSPSREGDLAHQVLKDFNGVLVSDFYAAYDSLTCAQQKCLIHLIRDLNEDVFKEPFNIELKDLVGKVAALLKPIIETIDRFGLKARFFCKHKTDVSRFFEWLSRQEYRSETASKCKQRLETNRDALFTFLDHDDIPWNNNNAEHAVKAFARLRREFVGLSTEKGIKEYLILLSVCQTCKYMGVDFLDFLRSGEKDIHAFAESRRRHRRSPTHELQTPPANAPALTLDHQSNGTP